MSAETAPTITIDGVTSRPGEPVSMVHLDCDGYMIVPGHVAEGDMILCEDGPHEEKLPDLYCVATGVFHTWTF